MHFESLDQYNSLQTPEIDTNQVSCKYVFELTPKELEFIVNKSESNRSLEYHDANYFQQKAASGAMLLKQWDELVGFIFEHNYIYQGEPISERWTLWVSPKLRGQKMGAFLMHSMTDKIRDKPLMSVTNVPVVQHINQTIMDFEVICPEWSFRSLVEEWWPIHDNYRIFINNKFHDLLS